MNKIRDIKLTAGNLSLRAELFAHGDITLAKLYSGDSSYFDGTNLDYGWAFRAPEDKPNRMKGMTVALDKAMDSAMLAPKLRHELLAQLKQDPNPWRLGTETGELQFGGKNCILSQALITHLQIKLPDDSVLPGGFGTESRKFWIISPADDCNWLHPNRVMAWRYADA